VAYEKGETYLIFLCGGLILHNPWIFLFVILLLSSFEDTKCGFVEERCIDDNWFVLCRK
jgi:hypothetical protein